MRTSGERVGPARYGGFATMPLGGRWRAGSSGRIAVDTDPWSGQALAEIPLADTCDLDRAFAAARETQCRWAAQSPAYLAEIMLSAAAVVEHRRAEIVDWLIHETGGILAKAELEWDLVRSVLINTAAVPYRAAGSIVPSAAAGRGSGVSRLPSSAAAGERLARTAGGAAVKRLALELGGNGPLVVLDDADVGRAADAAVFGSFFRHGQICMITNRLIVDRRVYDEFTERLVTEVRCLRAGDPAAADTDVGPLLSARQLSSVQDMLKRVGDEGARQVLGGEPGGPTGLLLPPHVLLARGDTTAAREAVVGPVITVLRARDADDALRIANQAEYGRSGAVFTADAERGARLAAGLAAGVTHGNAPPANEDANAAIGGTPACGIGTFGGRWAIETFTARRWVSQPQP